MHFTVFQVIRAFRIKSLKKAKSYLVFFEKNESFEILLKSPLLNKKKQIEVVSRLFTDKKEKKIHLIKICWV